MGAAAHDLPVLHHKDAVGVQNRAHPLGHDEHGGVPDALPQAGAQGAVGLHVQGREAVVKKVNLRLPDNRPGNGHPLALAAGKIGAALGDFGVVALRLLLDELVGAGDIGGLPPRLLAAVLFAKAQVGGHVPREKDVFLGDVADELPQVFQLVLPDVHAVYVDVAHGGVVDAGDQLEDGGLAAAGPADDGGHLAGAALEADVLQHRLVRPGVGKGDMVKNHAGPFGASAGAAAAAVDRAFGVQHLSDALCTGVRHGEEHDDHGQQDNGGQNHADILAVGHQGAYVHLAGGHIPGTHPHDGGGGHPEDDLDDWHQQSRHPPREDGGGGQFAVGLGKALHLPVLPVEGADYPHPFQRLEEKLVQPVDLAAQRHRVAGHQQDDDPRAQNEGGDSQVQHRAQLAPCQGREDQPCHRHQRGGDPQPQQQREKHLDVGHVGSAAGHQAGGAEPLHFSGGKALNLMEDLVPQIGSKASGHPGREDDGRHIEHTAQNGQGSHHRRHHHNGAAALARHTHVDHAGQGSG